MHILADENIPLAEAFFAEFGTLRRLPGRQISAADLEDCQVLLVRSVTRVDRELLAGSAVRFVGTCTIGTDHLDLDYLATAGIHWASAPGCNAQGVLDYVLSSLLCLAERNGEALHDKVYGVVGAGQVGGRLVALLRGLGWQVRVCDPPRQRREGGDFVSLEQLLAECNVISLHTPLSREGEDATWHLLDQARLAALRPGCWLINASRGEVVDNAALKGCLQAGQALQVVLDVWQGEPLVDVELAALCQLATPHIAGYSLDGKLRGSEQIYRALCAWLGQAPRHQLCDLLPSPWLAGLALSAQATPEWLLATLCRAVYDVRRDDADFRRSLQGDASQRRQQFDLLRKHYPMRRELQGLAVSLQGDNQQLAALLQALGCRLQAGRD